MSSALRQRLRDNGLSLATLAIFGAFMAAQTLTGLHAFNDEQREHGQPVVSLVAYLRSGHFIEATAENWESEFLQMAAYVLLTAVLVQRGSSESKKPDEPAEVDRDPQLSRSKLDAPWPVRRGGWVLRVYEHSLSIAFLGLFLIAFGLHAVGGTMARNHEAILHGEGAIGTLEFMRSSQFWFESFQNWQSEFLALVAMVTLSIYLRERGSPESKPVDASHGDTGSS